MKLIHGDMVAHSLTTEAADALFRMREIPDYHEQHGFPPPLSIYSESLRLIVNRMSNLLDVIEDSYHIIEVNSGCKIQDIPHDKIEEKLDTLLDAVCEHTEYCMRVLKCLYPADHETWSREREIRNYKSATRDFSNFIRRRVNHIKHKQGRVRTILVSDESGSHIGFFFEGPDSSGVLGPDPGIHPDNVAYSFSRILRYIMIELYNIGRTLAAAIMKVHDAPGRQLPAGAIHGNSLFGIVSRIVKIDEIVFPGEERYEWPGLRVYEGEKGRRIEMEYQSRYPRRLQKQLHITTTAGYYYGVTPHSYRMPTMGAKIQRKS